MRRLLLMLALLLASTGTARAAVEWEERGTLDAALKRAGSQGKWVLVDFVTTWCDSCREMDADVYARDDVSAALAKDYLTLRRDGEEGEGAVLVARYHVVGYPTLLVLTPEGAEVDRVMGAAAPRELLDLLARFRSGEATLATLEKRGAETHDPALLAEVARRHALRGDARTPAETEAVVAADPDDRAGRASQALLYLGKYFYLRGRHDNATAQRTLERLRNRYPRSQAADEVPYHLASAYHGLGDDARALATLDAYLAASPKAETYNTYVWCCYRNRFGFAHALAVAREGLTRFPGCAGLWDSLAELLAQEGRRAEALDAARRALSLEPGNHYFAAQIVRFGGTP